MGGVLDIGQGRAGISIHWEISQQGRLVLDGVLVGGDVGRVIHDNG